MHQAKVVHAGNGAGEGPREPWRVVARGSIDGLVLARLKRVSADPESIRCRCVAAVFNTEG